MMGLLRLVLAGLCLGGIVHVIIILLIPYEADKDAWSRIVKLGPPEQFNLVPVSDDTTNILLEQDPFLVQAACRISLDDTARRIQFSLTTSYWSIGVFNPLGINIFSVNDSASEKKQLNLVVLSPLQLARFQELDAADFDGALVVETRESDLFVIVRAFAKNDGAAKTLSGELSAANCLSYSPEQEDDGRVQ